MKVLSKEIKYSEIIKKLNDLNISISSKIEKDTIFSNIKSISKANKNDLSFFSNIKYINELKKIKAKGCLISEKYIEYLPKNCFALVVDDPYYVFAQLSKIFLHTPVFSNGEISKNTHINNDSIIHKNVQIDPFCYIDKKTEIFENVIIRSNSKIGPNVSIHKNCLIHDNVTLSNCIIMENCEIKSGVRIGGDGFGFEEKSKQKIYHYGNVIISNNCTIGSNTTIDRAVFDSTEIGEYSQIDNLVQIAHNVKIGKHSIIASQVGIAGSSELGDYVKIGGQSGIAGHLNIGNNVTIAGKSGVTKNIEDNKVVAGFPAKDINIWKREIIKLGKLK